ncbi:hypothetical protein H9W90_09750 [Polaribacter pectinis]|uniref:DUF4890 domain-containing protein n=1 Tax=Polaribacter pectinis TaxID=2738844 RepID=A0A7G9L780_9FLAO|nr:hypothetical protein [Polaribacter pectinis]QNM84479.1 hypothetical protein H9W90_09750 [Polaribacter pectinis]
MKNLASILVLVFAFTLNTQAQKKRDHKRPEFTVEQHTNLAVKKMTLALDLSEKQQNQIKPLIMAKASERKAAMEKRKASKETKKRSTSDEIYAAKSKMLDNQIAMKNRMKEILNKDQFEKFEKMHKKRKMKGKMMMKNKMKGKKHRKNKEHKKEHKDN